MPQFAKFLANYSTAWPIIINLIDTCSDAFTVMQNGASRRKGITFVGAKNDRIVF